MQQARLATRRGPYAVLGTDVSHATDSGAAIRTAGLNWEVEKVRMRELYISNRDDDLIPTSMPDRSLLMRSDNNAGLGVVGERYVPVDNAHAFTLADDIAAAGGRFDHAGELDGGRKTFLTLKLPDATIDLGNTAARVGDVLDLTAVLICDHAGSGAFTADLMVTRLACTNGMSVTVPQAQGADSVRIRHTASASDRIELARSIMRNAVRYSRSYAALAEHMATTPMTRTQFLSFIDDLFPEPEKTDKRAHTSWDKRRGEIISLWRDADTQDSGRDTRWAAFNAVTEWLTWSTPIRTTNRDDLQATRAMRQITSTSPAMMRQRAFNALTRDGVALVS